MIKIKDQPVTFDQINSYFESRIDLNSTQESIDAIDNLQEQKELYYTLHIYPVNFAFNVDNKSLAVQDFKMSETHTVEPYAVINIDDARSKEDVKEYAENLYELTKNILDKGVPVVLDFCGVSFEDDETLEGLQTLHSVTIIPHEVEKIKDLEETVNQFVLYASEYNEKWDATAQNLRKKFAIDI